MKSFYGFVIYLVISGFSHASNSFSGSVEKVITPGQFLVSNEKGHTLIIDVKGYKHDGQSCAQNTLNVCEVLEDKLVGEPVGVVVEGHVSGKVYGDITFAGSEVLSNFLIREGFYRINARDGRHVALLKSEREAICAYRGIWAVYRGQHEYAALCQGR